MCFEDFVAFDFFFSRHSLYRNCGYFKTSSRVRSSSRVCGVYLGVVMSHSNDSSQSYLSPNFVTQNGIRLEFGL